jgi:HPt (histidine-containing phosphotransfer) domain-containing protein
MARLKERFIERSQGDRETLVAALESNDRETLRRVAHSLSGAGGIFGFPGISENAALLEQAIDRDDPPDQLHERLGRLLAAIDTSP